MDFQFHTTALARVAAASFCGIVSAGFKINSFAAKDTADNRMSF